MLRLLVIASLFLTTFAGNSGLGGFKKKSKKNSENPQQTEQQEPALAASPQSGIGFLSAATGGMYFTMDSQEIYFLVSESQRIEFVGESFEPITHFSVCSGLDSAYFVAGSRIYFLNTLDQRFTISEGVETGGPVHSLVCDHNQNAFASIENSIVRFRSNGGTVAFRAKGPIGLLALQGLTLYFNTNSRVYLLKPRRGHAKPTFDFIEGTLDHFVVFENGDFACAIGADFFYRYHNVRGSGLSQAAYSRIELFASSSSQLVPVYHTNGHAIYESQELLLTPSGLPENASIVSMAAMENDILYISYGTVMYRWDRSISSGGLSTLTQILLPPELFRRACFRHLFHFRMGNFLALDIVHGPIAYFLYSLFLNQYTPQLLNFESHL